MQDFLVSSPFVYCSHSEDFFSTVLKPFSELLKIFSKFPQISMQFLHTCSFSKAILTFQHNFSVKRSYFLRRVSKFASKFIRKIRQI